MRISTAATLALTILLATTTLGAVAATPSASTPTTVERSSSVSSSLSPALDQSQPVSSSAAVEPSETLDTRQIIRIRITDDGDAVWTLESRFLVANESEANTFNKYAKEVVSGSPAEVYDVQGFEQKVSSAAESTGREMAVENAGWDEPRIEQLETDTDQSADGNDVRVGIISYSFTWTNFATVDGDQIRVGDALQTADGPLIRTLSAGQRLVIEPPENYGFVDAPTGTEDGALVWDGPHQFSEKGLEITILRGAGAPLLSETGWLVVGVLGLVIVVGAGGYLLARRERDSDGAIVSDRLPSSEIAESLGVADWLRSRKTATDRGSATAERSHDPETVAGSPTDSSMRDPPGSGTYLEFEEPSDDDIDPELLSDEERVLRLLKQNGGRMKQASIVSETGWSNAKVSQLLSKMDDNDEIKKLRIGRENLITLPGVDPTELD